MHFFFSGPRVFGVRPGIVLGPRDFQPRTRAVEGSFLYVIQGAPGYVKVGVTKNPAARLADLQTGSPFPLEFVALAATPGTGYDIEARAHEALDFHRSSGEWFRIHPHMAMMAITVAARELGQPLLSVTPEAADSIVAAAGRAPHDAPARSRALSKAIVWSLAGVLAFLVVLAVLGH